MSEKDNLKIKIGARIRELRSGKGLTGNALAKMSDISPAYLSEVERGLSNISGEKLNRIAEALMVPLQEILTPSSDKNDNSTINIPIALSKAAEQLNLKFSTTIQLYQGQKSLVGRRSTTEDSEWNINEWINFYESVKPFLKE